MINRNYTNNLKPTQPSSVVIDEGRDFSDTRVGERLLGTRFLLCTSDSRLQPI